MNPLRLPLSVKMPLVVTVFMAAVAIFVTERVLSRLEETQARHLRDLATVYLDGLASALADPVVREDVWEVFDILDRARQTHAGMKPTETVVATTEARVLASSDPRSIPPGRDCRPSSCPTTPPHQLSSRAKARARRSPGATWRQEVGPWAQCTPPSTLPRFSRNGVRCS